MKYSRFRFLLLTLIAAILVFVLGRLWLTPPTIGHDAEVRASTEPGGEPSPSAAAAKQTMPAVSAEPTPAYEQEAQFSPEMARLVTGIHAGRPVTVRLGDSELRYLFRPRVVTSENFRISVGLETEFASAFEVFEGRRILADGSLVESASLAVVNDAVSMALETEAGSILVERNESGEQVARLLFSTNPELAIGDSTCVQDGNIAGVQILNEKPIPEWPVSVVLAGGGGEIEPDVAGAWADHNYYRNGSQYDASLKDINILMVSGSSQTGSGSSSNLSSRAASYLTYAAMTADTYENQLGMRYLLQEIVLIPSGSGQPDIEVNSQDSGTQLDAVRDWAAIYRPQATYKWGHVAGWTGVSSAGGRTRGWSWVARYGTSTYGVSVQERGLDWRVHQHELGHNVGANHTNGGSMNSNVSNAGQDFFTVDIVIGGFTAAKSIYDYMSVPGRSFVYGPADLRHPEEIPFAIDDNISTPVDTAISFNPLINDQTSVLFGATNQLRLVEVGQVFPKSAGTASVVGGKITFTPASGYTGNAWFRYTLGGDVGNYGKGWLHAADVVITVGGNASDPSQSPAISTTLDRVKTDFSGDIRINPLLNDEGKGRLWAGGVDVLSDVNGTAESYSDGAFFLVDANVINGTGSVSLETVEMNRNAAPSTGNTGYLVYTPGVNELAQVEIQYTVEDADGNQSTGTILLEKTETVSVTMDVSNLIENQGRVATVTFARTGPSTEAEWVDFSVTGLVTLHGAQADLALSGFDSFDPETGVGRITIPAGQSAAELRVVAKSDTQNEGVEKAGFLISALESLLIDSDLNAAFLRISDVEDAIGAVIASEDFDSFPAGTALASGWTNEATSPGVWTADSGGTPSESTGPVRDHTQGNASGVYLYREASGFYNEQADLTSPTIDLSGADSPILEFYYHMYGSDMGELRVDVFSGGSWNLDVIPPLIGSQQSDPNADWARASIDVAAYKSADFRVRFRGITGPWYKSDMAIDDFTVGEPQVLATEAPVIIGQPQSQILGEGDAAYLSVVAQAYPAPTYQWKKGGVTIPGATQPVLYLASAQASDQGDYTCEVTSGSTVTSAVATLTLPIPAPTGLSASQGGDSVLLDWADSLHPDFDSYVVYRREVGGSYGSPLQSNLTVSAFEDTSVANGMTYYYVVTAVEVDTNESLFSEEVSITFLENLSPPVVDAGVDQSVVLVGNVEWTPAQMTTAAWYDASDAATLTLSGSSVTAWADKSGNDLHLVQGVANKQPQFGVNTINGMTTVKFDGSNDNLVTGSNPFAAGGISDAMVIVVHRHDASARGTLFSLSGTSANTGRWQAHAPWTSTMYFDAGGGRINTSYGVAVGDVILASFYNSTTEGVQQVYKNGALLVGDTTANSTNTVGNIFMGSSADTQYQNTSIAEMIIINGTVGVDDRQKLEGYLAHKWGQAGNLPAGHPYKSASPGGSEVTVTLGGTISDLDGGTPSSVWTKVSGPGNVLFGDETAAATTAIFTKAGTYVLRLTADDEVYQSSDEITVTVRIDDDSDGISDDWETLYFPGQEATIDGSSDSDSDGVLDFFEYLYGSDPTDGASAGFQLSAGPDGGHVAFIWEVQDGFVLGSDYLVEISTDLSDPAGWGPLPTEDYTLASSTSNGMTSLSLKVTADYGDHVFIRLVKP